MAPVTIRSGMHRFQMIAAIRRMDAHTIEGISCLGGTPAYAGLEAMAQLAALHVRWRVEYARHAFLLKVVRCRGLSENRLTGTHFVQARLESHSTHAFRYMASAAEDGGDAIAGELLIGLRDYDEQFQAPRLQRHYRTMVDNLCEASG